MESEETTPPPVEGFNLFAVSRLAGRSCNIRVHNIHSSNIPFALHLGKLVTKVKYLAGEVPLW